MKSSLFYMQCKYFERHINSVVLIRGASYHYYYVLYVRIWAVFVSSKSVNTVDVYPSCFIWNLKGLVKCIVYLFVHS